MAVINYIHALLPVQKTPEERFLEALDARDLGGLATWISDVEKKTVKAIYLDLVDEEISPPETYRERAKLLEVFLEHVDLENQKKIFDFPNYLEYIAPDLILKIAESFHGEEEDEKLWNYVSAIDQEETLRRLLPLCLKNKLLLSLAILVQKDSELLDSKIVNGWISQALQAGRRQDIYEMIPRIAPPSLGHIFSLDPSFFNNYVKERLEAGQPIFSPALVLVLDLLDTTTTVAVFKRLEEYLKNEAPLDQERFDQICQKEEQTPEEMEFLERKGDFDVFYLKVKKSTPFAFKHDYESQEDKSFTLISKGTQRGKDGITDTKKAKEICQALNEKAPPTVRFAADRVEDHLEGGTCTALSMRLLKEYRKARNESANAEEALKKIGDQFKTSSPELRTIQAAYNTIEKTATTSADFKKDKMEALLHYENPDLKITHCLGETKDSKEMLGWDITEGIYVMRMLCPIHPQEVELEYQVKEEYYGHTTILILEEEKAYYYDPGIGTVQLHNPTQLLMLRDWQKERWDLPLVRLYQIGAV